MTYDGITVVTFLNDMNAYCYYLNVLNEYEIDSDRDMYGNICSMYHLYCNLISGVITR